MNEFINLARQFFLSYCHIINPSFKRNWHHEVIARHLEEIADGKPKRLIISLPPRHGKTFQISQHFPTYYMGKNPKKNVISTAYSQALAEDFGEFVKKMMMTQEYMTIFPVQVTKTTKSKKRFSLVQGGNYYAVGRGGPITGRGGHLIIIDDLIKNDQEARSETYRRNLLDWYKNTLRTRLMPNGSIIIVQTRWHEQDLIGELLKNSKENWEYVKLPAIDQNNKALWPEFYPLEVLETIRKEIGSQTFDGLYQQEPRAMEGNIIKRSWIQRYNQNGYFDEETKTMVPFPKKFDNLIITGDLTFKGNDGSDYAVFQKWGKAGPNYWLLDMMRGQWDFTQQLFHVKQFVALHKDCTNIVIEDAANASAIFSTIKQHISGLTLWKPETSKEVRLVAVAPLFEAKNVYIPEGTKYDIFISELIGFPRAAHDDTVDTGTLALLKLKGQSAGLVMALGERTF